VKLHLKVVLLVGVLALAAAPAAALAVQPAEPGNGHGAAGEGPQPSSPPPTEKAYGYYCQDQSKEHVAGIPGTPFSTCVKAHELAAAHPNMRPGQVCKGTSGKHVKGEKGTPHSRCVAEIVELRKEEREAAA
jgi:hypothetical protein